MGTRAVYALSIRQPWAWLIVHGYKDIENRKWRASFRGRFLVHASAGMTRKEYDEVKLFTMQISNRKLLIGFPSFSELTLQRGGFVGSAEMTDCVTESNSPWFFGPFGFFVQDSRLLPFTPYKGQLGFFRVRPDENTNNLL